jgi:hypothetical protein
LESIARCSKTHRRTVTRLRDTDDMQDQKQRHGERGNVAHGKDGHDSAGDSVRINDTGEHAQDQSIDKVGDSQTRQKMKPLRCAGLANRRAANGAVTPIAISPLPAGKAKNAGRIL